MENVVGAEQPLQEEVQREPHSPLQAAPLSSLPPLHSASPIHAAAPSAELSAPVDVQAAISAADDGHAADHWQEEEEDEEDAEALRLHDGDAASDDGGGAASPAPPPLALLVSSVMGSSDEKYSAHRPMPILTSNLGPARPALPARPSSSLSVALTPTPTPPLPARPSSQNAVVALEPGLAPAQAAANPYGTLSHHALDTPTSSGSAEDSGFDADADAALERPPGDYAEPQPLLAPINISYAEPGEGEPLRAYSYAANAGEGKADEAGADADSAPGGGTLRSISGTTVPYPHSSGTFVPPPLQSSRFTYGGGDEDAHFVLGDGEDGLGAISGSIQSTTTASEQPYNTASSLQLLQPPERALSPSAHSTPPHLRPSSALSLYSPEQEQRASSSSSSSSSSSQGPQDDQRGTMKSAISVLSYEGVDDEVGERDGEFAGDEEPGVDGRLHRRGESYQYGVDAGETKEGEEGFIAAGLTAGAAMAAVHEEKEDEGGVVVVDEGHDEAAVLRSEIELQRANSSLADRWAGQQPPPPNGEEGALAAAAATAATVTIAVNVNVSNSSGRCDENENREGQPRVAAGRGGRRRRKSPLVDGEPGLVHWPLFTAAVIVVDIILFIVPWAWSSWHTDLLSNNPMYGPDGPTLLHFGAKFAPALLIHDQRWRLLVSCFLHAGVIHVIFSLSIGLMYSFQLEQEYGWYRLLPIWVVSGIFSQLWSSLLNPSLVSVGGGAALAGIVAAWLADFVHTHARIANKWMYLARNVVASSLIFASGVFPYVDNWGLGSGAVMGFLLALVLFAPVHRTREGRWKVHHLPVAVPALLLAVALLIATPVVLYGQDPYADGTYSTRGNAQYLGCVSTSYWNCSVAVPSECINSDTGAVQPANDTSEYC